MKPISLLIFDLDGTLVNTLEDIAASVNFTLQKLGRPLIPLDAVRQYVGDGVEMLMRRALGGEDGLLADAVGVYTVHHSRNLMTRSRLYPSVKDTLEYFQALPMAVITNKSSEFVHPLMEGLGIARYFRLILGADSGLPLKPAPDALVKIMAELEAPKERTAIVGDGTTDVRAGKAAGVITCSVTYGFRTEEELKKAGPDHVIRDLSELKGLFKAE
ncbi:MAG TPA: HAD-IA family hydrolase [Nitrospirota bacterium]